MDNLKLSSLLLLLILAKFNLATFTDEYGPIVQIKQGLVRGLIKNAVDSRPFYAFLGIPYAKPPIGNLRFKAPVAADSWSDIYNATTDPDICVQPDSGEAKGAEDCLYVSVYTPNNSSISSLLLPVQVFIHGGSFVEGDIHYNSFNPEFYMTTDMVVVLASYRLGVLGFLSTEDEAASGNFGLLDQNLALQWVKDNIASFGGNKDDVTLAGQSAGSASVLFHVLSPKSAGLFNKVIAQSGSALCPWAVEENPLFYAQQLGANFNCTNDTFELVDCLKQQDAGELVSFGYQVMVHHLKVCFVPVVENSSTGQFLTEDPWSILENGNFNQVPLLMGTVRDEGTFIFRYINEAFTVIDDNFFNDFVPILIRCLTDYRSNLINVSYALKDEYYTDVDLNNQTAVNIASINMISDMYMKSWIVKTAQLVSEYNITTYIYAYDYVSNTSSSYFTGEPDITHGNELKYLFRSSYDMNSKDASFGESFFNLWSNFIINGNPTPTNVGNEYWSPDFPGDTIYYDINDIFTMMGSYDPEKLNFWWNTVPSIVYS